MTIPIINVVHLHLENPFEPVTEDVRDIIVAGDGMVPCEPIGAFELEITCIRVAIVRAGFLIVETGCRRVLNRYWTGQASAA